MLGRDPLPADAVGDRGRGGSAAENENEEKSGGHVDSLTEKKKGGAGITRAALVRRAFALRDQN
jgi:hypothetical protein